jgi:hypothetical protein
LICFPVASFIPLYSSFIANLNPSLQSQVAKFIFRKAGLVLPNNPPPSLLAVTHHIDGKNLIPLADSIMKPELEQLLAAETSELMISTWEVQFAFVSV